MPLIQDSHDSLPYIDPDPTPQARAKIADLLAAELPNSHATPPHPLLPAHPESTFTPLVTAELARIAAGTPLAAIDTARYEELSPPSPSSNDALGGWKTPLQQAYASHAYLSARLDNLALLDGFGKNAWLVANSQLEDVLRGLEREVVHAGQEVERVNHERKTAQEGVRGEMEGLEEAWRGGVGRAVEAQVAAEGLRAEAGRARRGGKA